MIMQMLAEETTKPVFLISSSAHLGLKEILSYLLKEVQQTRSVNNIAKLNQQEGLGWSPH
jgi:hypothetical protein